MLRNFLIKILKKICTNPVTNSIIWLDITHHTNEVRGAFFACEVQEFLENVQKSIQAGEKFMKADEITALEEEIAKHVEISKLTLLDKIEKPTTKNHLISLYSNFFFKNL